VEENQQKFVDSANAILAELRWLKLQLERQSRANEDRKRTATSLELDTEQCIENFRQNVLQYIKDKNISQSEFARRIGVNPGTVAGIFYSGIYKPSIGTVIKIIRITQKSFEELIS